MAIGWSALTVLSTPSATPPTTAACMAIPSISQSSRSPVAPTAPGTGWPVAMEGSTPSALPKRMARPVQPRFRFPSSGLPPRRMETGTGWPGRTAGLSNTAMHSTSGVPVRTPSVARWSGSAPACGRLGNRFQLQWQQPLGVHLGQQHGPTAESRDVGRDQPEHCPYHHRRV